MKSVIGDKKEREHIKISDIIKYGLVAFAIPAGLILSGVLAYLNIDFIELLNIFIESISDPEVLDKLAWIMRKWYIISFALFSATWLLLAICSVCYRKKDEEDALTWVQTLFLTSLLILMTQVVLPSFTIIAIMLIALVYLLFYLSIPLQNVIRYAIYLFVLIVEKVCTNSGLTLTYDDFIGQERYSMFLTVIIFFILIPYLLPWLLEKIKKFIQCVVGDKLIGLIFKPVEVLVNVKVLRYTIYILLFFISVFTYSVNISQPDYALSLVKEALLEFVLLDTVMYSIYSDSEDIKISHKQQNMRKYYTPFKYDLEFVLSAITMHNLNSKEIHACIKFSVDMNRILKGKKQKDVGEIDELLIDISTNYYKIEILEQKIKVVLSKVNDLIA